MAHVLRVWLMFRVKAAEHLHKVGTTTSTSAGDSRRERHVSFALDPVRVKGRSRAISHQGRRSCVPAFRAPGHGLILAPSTCERYICSRSAIKLK